MPRWEPLSREERFWAKVTRGEGCWEWTGALRHHERGGYGQFHDGRRGRAMAAHRYSWVLHNGPIPDGLCVLHHCDNRRCVRPDHLWLGTNTDNMRDMAAKGRNFIPPSCAPGEGNGYAKLTDEAVRTIRASTELGVALAAKYGVTPSAISVVRHRKAWRHVV